jgi:hypothetical protein
MTQQDYMKLPNDTIFTLANGVVGSKDGPMDYVNLAQKEMGTVQLQPNEFAGIRLGNTMGTEVVTDVRRAVEIILNKYRIPGTLLGDAGIKELIAACTPSTPTKPAKGAKKIKKAAHV